MIRRRQGLAVGKFWPPHLGHHAMIDRLSQECEHVVVVVCSTSSQVPTGLDRSLWLQQAHPAAEVITVDDFCDWHFPEPCPTECTARWAARITALGLGSFDIVATSESYGDSFAGALGAAHLNFDPTRATHSVSGTDVRAALQRHWEDLHPVTQAGLYRRVVVLGAESTGTSTLTCDLSEALGLPSTPELGRTVSWALYADAGSMQAVEWTNHHFWTIVNAQIRTEVLALCEAARRTPSELGPWLVCDTDTLATVAWWERYLATPPVAVLELALARPADLYLVTSPEGVRFDDSDPTRDGRHIRTSMHERLLQLVEMSGRPFEIMEGTRAERLSAATEAMRRQEREWPRFRR